MYFCKNYYFKIKTEINKTKVQRNGMTSAIKEFVTKSILKNLRK